MSLGTTSHDGELDASRSWTPRGHEARYTSATQLTRPSTQTNGGVHLPYRSGIDGLRALAVMAVLAYHAQISWVKGGFLGVEVFFVISGYLITALLLRESTTRGRISLGLFYVRRARRLLPAFFVLLFATTAIAVVFLPDEVATLRGDVIAALAYVTNWFFVFGQKSYFESAGRPSLVQHLWSLAVEEQFYLIWPLLFTAGMRFLGKRRLLVAVLVGAAASTVLLAVLYSPDGDPSRSYYGTDSRAAGLLLGTALAFVWPPWRLRRRVGRATPMLLDTIGTGALVGLGAMLVTTDEFSSSLYRGGFLKVSLLTVALIAVVVHPAPNLGRVLSVGPLRWIGLRSYGIYLFHWPVFQLTRPEIDVPFTGLPLLVLRFGITIVLADLSYRYVERPIRNGAVTRALEKRRMAPVRQRRIVAAQWVSGAFACVAVVSGLAVVVGQAQPPIAPDYMVIASGETARVGEVWSDGPSIETSTAGATRPKGTGSTATTGVNSTTTSAIRPPLASLFGDPPSVDGATTTTTMVGVPFADASITLSAGPIGFAAATAATAPITPGTVPATREGDSSTKPPPEPAAPPRRITAIGDSVMLGAKPVLEAGLPGTVFVDAAVGRAASTGIAMLRTWRDNGYLGDVVVVHLGNNGPFSHEQFDEIAGVLSGVQKVIFVNVKVPRPWEDSVNETIASGVARMPNAVVVDWRGASSDHPEYFWTDSMHLRPEGAAAYNHLIASQM